LIIFLKRERKFDVLLPKYTFTPHTFTFTKQQNEEIIILNKFFNLLFYKIDLNVVCFFEIFYRILRSLEQMIKMDANEDNQRSLEDLGS
jgi:hypothetical protein